MFKELLTIFWHFFCKQSGNNFRKNWPNAGAQGAFKTVLFEEKKVFWHKSFCWAHSKDTKRVEKELGLCKLMADEYSQSESKLSTILYTPKS